MANERSFDIRGANTFLSNEPLLPCAFSCLGLVGEKSVRIGANIPTGRNVGRQQRSTPAPPIGFCMSPPEGLTSKETETTLTLSWRPPKCQVMPDFYKVEYIKHL